MTRMLPRGGQPSNPQPREIWDGFSDAEKAEGYAEYGALAEELTA